MTLLAVTCQTPHPHEGVPCTRIRSHGAAHRATTPDGKLLTWPVEADTLAIVGPGSPAADEPWMAGWEPVGRGFGKTEVAPWPPEEPAKAPRAPYAAVKAAGALLLALIVLVAVLVAPAVVIATYRSLL